MCGIAGIFKLDGHSVTEETVKLMNQAQKHRGPDGDGVFCDGNIGLGHVRLAILDVTEQGNQPMKSASGDWVVSFNGCIYNFKELRSELELKGYRFQSGTDTEVIANALELYGADVIKRFNGMFAIAAWNKRTRSLIISRDRFGIKPLYYWFHNQTLVFASEVKAIAALPEYSVEVDKKALGEYFTFQNLFSYRTLFKGISVLPPANTIHVDASTREIVHNSWWDFEFSQPDESISFEDARSETNRLFRQAVERQMVADVPVGSYLSGGMDSGSITAIASSHVKRLATFTCGFDMSTVSGYESNYDERRDAEILASYLKTEHYEQVINAGDLSWSLPRVVYHLENLRVGMSYPNYYISRLASKFVKVCLQGTGGDELYGGYPWRYYKVFDSIGKEEFFDQYYDFWQRLVPDNRRNSLFTTSMSDVLDPDEPRYIFERVFRFNPDLKYDKPEHHIQNSLYFEIKTFLPGLLTVGDKLSMANGLEERFPFLDNDLVDFAQKIPVRHKLGNLSQEIQRIDENVERKKWKYREFDDGKNVLRKAMTDILPQEVLNRKKQGFSAPDESWYRGENASFVKNLLLNKNTISTEFIQREFIEQILNEHNHHKVNHRLIIWSLMCFEYWCKIFLNGEKFE